MLGPAAPRRWPGWPAACWCWPRSSSSAPSRRSRRCRRRGRRRARWRRCCRGSAGSLSALRRCAAGSAPRRRTARAPRSCWPPALAPVPLLLPRAGLLWSVPGARAAARRGRARAGVRRARGPRADRLAARRPGGGGLPLAGARRGAHRRDLLFGVADGTLPRAELGGLAHATPPATRSCPLVTSPALAPVAVWAAFAVVAAARGAGPLPGPRPARRGRLGGRAGGWRTRRSATCSPPTTAWTRRAGRVAGALLGVLVAVAVTAIAPPVRGARGDASPDPALP